jgi:folate-binding protein YgfZ
MCLCAALPPEPAPPPGGVPLTEADWAWVNITQGIAWVSAATQDSFTPHMLDLDRLGAVSFTKGCYPGQEVVARTQYLGKAKRRMYRLGFSAQGLPESGAPVYSPEGGDQPVGTFIDCARGPGGLEALVVLPSSAVAQGQIRALRPDGPLMQPLPLPFAIEA